MKTIVRSLSVIMLMCTCGAAKAAVGKVTNVMSQDTCFGISTLPCSAIKVTLPFSLDFNQSKPNSLLDKTGQGIGFTTVNSYSGTRVAQDGQPSNSAIKGYEPAKISLAGGQLHITANKGIDYLTNNNQLNVVGAQIAAANKLQLEVKVVNPFNGTQSQQAGLWYGLNDKTFIKLSITGNKVELRKEFNDVSSTLAGNINPDQRITPVITGLNTKTVTLRLVIDCNRNTAEGFYSIDGNTFLSTGASYSSSAINLLGMGLTANDVFAGLYASYRNGTSPVNYAFDDFIITSTTTPAFAGCPFISTLPCASIKVNTPFNLSFDQSVANSIGDKNGSGTGFKTVNNYSGTRLPVDGQPTIAEVPGFDSSKINLVSGYLQITANKGIDYQANNNQLNVLGVQIDAANKVQLDVKLINPYNGSQSQQAGLWYGVNDKTYIKLGVTGNKVELRKEFNDVSSGTAGSSNPDQRITSVLSGLNTKTVRLRLLIDSAAQTVEGFYCIDGINYVSVGAVGYAQKFLNIAGTNLTTGEIYAGIFATYRNGTSPVIYTFDDFSVIKPQPVQTQKKLSFSRDTISFTVVKNGPVIAQSVNLTGDPATSSISISKINADWLTLPVNSVGTIIFNAQNINSSTNAGIYQGLIAAAAVGYKPDTIVVNLTVVEPPSQQAINVNFGDALTVPPTGYVRDYGQAFGDRTGQYQGALLSYGWRKKPDGSPLSLVGNGRNRNTPEDIVLATIFHMQANNISGAFTGVKTEGYWEVKLPNGTYDVTATVGDGQVNTAPESHSLNIEGVSAIANFIPNGKKGDIGRFKTKTVRVTLADENLSITADGGTNTKIAGASIVPVILSPYLYWSAGNVNLVAKKGNTGVNIFTQTLGNSSNAAIPYTINVQYSGTANGWLSFTPTASGAQSTLAFNYNSSTNLPVGFYSATVKAASGQYTSSEFKVQLNVVDSLTPYVKSATPANGSSNVSVNTVSIAANNLSVPAVEGSQGGVDNSTITNSTVKLFKLVDNQQTAITGIVQGTGGGDAISFSPSTVLEPNTIYKFVITNGVKSKAGVAFTPYESSFTTGDLLIDTANRLNAQFTKVAIPGTQNVKYSTLVIGPDSKFYALRLNGAIEKYDIDHSTGMLSNKQTINTLTDKYGERTAIGLAFDPSSTLTNPVLWVTHSSGGLTAAPAFDGNLSRLHGSNLEFEELVITKLPRSTRDHMVNSIAFGPDNALYINQGSNSSAGEYDDDWQRKETLLAGAVLRLDLQKLSSVQLPLNVQTTSNQAVINNAPAVSALMTDGTYNPYGSQSPLTIYASGVRNAYDLVWHSNGQLYVPTNGSGGGGNSPASVNGTRRPDGTIYNGPSVPATTGVPVQVDWLFRINPAKPVGYFGHPNPLRGEYVINRGRTDNPLYSAAVVPDVNYRQGYNFGLNHSPNGAIEYKSNTFNGILRGKLLVCRFSGGGDIVVMEPGSMVKIDPLGDNDSIYDIVKVTTGSGYNGLTGMSGFANPLDIVEDVTNGNLYVAELNWNDNPNLTAQITLLQAQAVPSPPSPLLAVTADQEASDSDNRKVYSINLANKGEGLLKVKSIALAGTDSKLFDIKDIQIPTVKSPLLLKRNSSLNFNVKAKSSSRRSVAKLIVTDIDNVSRIIEINNEPDTTSTQTYNDIAGAKKEIIASIDARQLTVYPNPNSGNIIYTRLKNFPRKEKVDVALYDMMGKMLKQQNVVTDANGQYATQFTVGNAGANKFYVIRATYPSGSRYSKVIIN